MVELENLSQSGGSNPTPPLQFAPCRLKDIKQFIVDNHYTHGVPGGCDLNFKAEYKGTLVGAMSFGYAPGSAKSICFLPHCQDQHRYRTLQRLVLLDACPKNSESRFIGWGIRWLKRNTNLIALVSYADEAHGHKGVIYKASNWIYKGLSIAHHNRFFIEGKEIHPRMLKSRYGHSRIKELPPAVTVQKPSIKHKYIYILKDS